MNIFPVLHLREERIFVRTLVKIFIFVALTVTAIAAQASSPRRCLDKAAGLRIFRSMLCKPASFPITFTYEGRTHKGFGGLEILERSVSDVPGGKEAVMRFSLGEGVEIKSVAKYNAEFGETEYTVWFANTGSKASGTLENVESADIAFVGRQPLVRGNLGDHVNLYAPYSHDLTKQPLSFRSDGGRATHVVFPYFDLVHGDGGTLLALGWAGTWNATFTSSGNTTHFKAANCNGFRAALLPGETVRTALVVMLPYKGRFADDATNLWREWFIKYNMPRADGHGNSINPLSTACFAGDTGLPNSDGSISERFYTWRRTLDRLVYEHTVPDFRWFDAGWYFDPYGKTVDTDWWGTIGTWELDTIKWPGKTFRTSNDACHKAGMKVMMWFEPERVTHVDGLIKNYGYKAEWAISNGHGVITNDLGNPDCLKWTLRRILRTMDAGGADLYREDNNSDPGTTWPLNDSATAAATSLPRAGITENKAIQGHYALWDSIIAHCARTGKCTYIDNCASGGGRNDIESLRRSIPFLRSDADRTTSALRLSMTSTFCKWIPYCGASTREGANAFDEGTRGGSTTYVNRASWLPVYNISENFTHDPALDYDRLRRNYGEWRKYSHLLTKDFYVLSPYHSGTDTDGWTVFAYSDHDSGETVIEAFRQENCKDSVFNARMKFTEPATIYNLENDDTGEKLTLSGKMLASKGFVIRLDKPKSSSVWHITRQ